MLHVLFSQVLSAINPLAGLILAEHTWTIKYTSQVMLEALPALSSLLVVVFYLRSRRKKSFNRWTLLSAIMGILPLKGRVAFAGQDLARYDIEDRVALGLTLGPLPMGILSLVMAHEIGHGCNARHDAQRIPPDSLEGYAAALDVPGTIEHALNIDFVDEAQGPGARVAVELSLEAARNLVATIQAVLKQAEAGGYLD